MALYAFLFRSSTWPATADACVVEMVLLDMSSLLDPVWTGCLPVWGYEG